MVTRIRQVDLYAIVALFKAYEYMQKLPRDYQLSQTDWADISNSMQEFQKWRKKRFIDCFDNQRRGRNLREINSVIEEKRTEFDSKVQMIKINLFNYVAGVEEFRSEEPHFLSDVIFVAVLLELNRAVIEQFSEENLKSVDGEKIRKKFSAVLMRHSVPDGYVIANESVKFFMEKFQDVILEIISEA